MLIAAGAVLWERWLLSLHERSAHLVRGLTWGVLALGGLAAAAIMLPVAPVNSDLWKVSSKAHDNFVEEIGWQELDEPAAMRVGRRPLISAQAAAEWPRRMEQVACDAVGGASPNGS